MGVRGNTSTVLVPLFVAVCLLTGCSQKSTTSSTSAPQTTISADSTPIRLPVQVGGKTGYVDGTGQLVITPQFNEAREFHEGRAAICIGAPCRSSLLLLGPPEGALWGFIDASGRIVVAPQYPEVSDFHEGVASVCTGDCGVKPTKPSSNGYIDKDGKVVIPMQFAMAESFSEGLAAVCVGGCQHDSNGKGKFGFIDHSGHFVINPQYDIVGSFTNGFATVTVVNGNDYKVGYVDKTGKVIWQPSN